LGIFFGARIAASVDWRTAFFAIGLAGLPVAWAIWKFVPEPLRAASQQSGLAAPALREVMRTIASKPGYWLMTFGTAFSALVSFGLIFWLPGFFSRSFGFSLAQLSWFYGSIVLIGGVAGTLLGGWLADRFGPTRPGAYALIPAVCTFFAAPAYVAGLLTESLPAVWILFTVGQALSFAWQGPVWTALYRMVLPTMRATVSATILLANNLIGLGLGIFLLGELSTRLTLTYGADGLRYSLLYVVPLYAFAGLLYLAAVPRMVKDTEPSLSDINPKS
jgi:predicted MFS family arabinose efflux permease